MQYPASKIRNICLLGHGGDGKTSLTEAMLFFTKGTDRLGKVAEGNTVSDFDAEEIKRKISISTSIAPVEWNGNKINVIDTPGYFDFEGEALQGIHAAESAAIVLSAKDGINVGAEKAYKLAKKNNLPILFFISKIDEENSDFHKVFNSLKATYGSSVCAINIPVIEDGKICGFINLIDLKFRKNVNGKIEELPIPGFMTQKIEEFREVLKEALAETSEDMMQKFFSGEEFTLEECRKGLSEGIKNGSITPVLAGSAITLEGIYSLLDFIVNYMPTPEVKENDPTALSIFKTIADPFVGKMSFFKVLSGSVSTGAMLTNKRSGISEKFSHVYLIKGKKQTEVETFSAGDIGVVTKLSATNTEDVLFAAGANTEVEPIVYPRPCLSRAIVPKAKGDEDKISQGLQRLSEEDPTFSYVNNAETHEQIISGMGETHLDVIVNKLKTKFGVGVDLKEAKVPYREAIRKKVKQQGKHKKQSGGHGQYGDVWIEFEPYDGEEMIFEEKVFGGAVPKNFFPAVEKGLRECCERGVLAGYPLVGLKATLVDGSYHDVDSSEMSFKMAAAIAYKEGLKNASPTILEPIGNLKVEVPDHMMGDIIGDINKRRGQILGMSPASEPGMQEVSATVPMSEMSSYAIDLRSMTRGRGSFTLDFSCYQDAPANVVQQVIEASKKDEDEE